MMNVIFLMFIFFIYFYKNMFNLYKNLAEQSNLDWTPRDPFFITVIQNIFHIY